MIISSKILGSSGKDVLILHGFLGSGDNWISIARKIVECGFKVHLIDQRNHGISFHADLFNYDVMSNDLVDYLKFHNIDQPIILGHSMGGKTAMNFALNHPKLLSKLFIIDISTRFYPSHHDYIMNALLKLDLKKMNKRVDVENELSESIKDVSLRNFLLKNLFWSAPQKLNFRFNLKSLYANIDKIGSEIISNNQFTNPSFFFRGENSDYINDSDIKSIPHFFPNSKLITISNSGHWLHVDNSEEFLDNLIKHL